MEGNKEKKQSVGGIKRIKQQRKHLVLLFDVGASHTFLTNTRTPPPPLPCRRSQTHFRDSVNEAACVFFICFICILLFSFFFSNSLQAFPSDAAGPSCHHQDLQPLVTVIINWLMNQTVTGSGSGSGCLDPEVMFSHEGKDRSSPYCDDEIFTSSSSVHLQSRLMKQHQ